MRQRIEIENDVPTENDTKLLIEVLLDIRDILAAKEDK